jgi:hypothetical protein
MDGLRGLAGALASDERLRVYGRIVAAGAAGVGTDEVTDDMRHVSRLRLGGLVTLDDDGRLRADAEPFRTAIRRSAPADAPAGAPGPVANLFSGGRLVAIPGRSALRRALLEFLATDLFEPDRTYTEPEVNAAILRYHDDRSALRRYLVEEHLLTRTPDGASYRRTSG